MVAPALSDARATLEAGQDELATLFGQLTEAELIRPGTIGGSGWAAKDLVGHIAFWEELAIEAIEAWRAGRVPHVASISGPTGTDRANAANQERSVSQSPAQVRARSATAHQTLVAALDSLSEAEWQAPASRENPAASSLGEMLGGVLGAPNQPFGHAYAHLDDLRDYVRSLGKQNG